MLGIVISIVCFMHMYAGVRRVSQRCHAYLNARELSSSLTESLRQMQALHDAIRATGVRCPVALGTLMTANSRVHDVLSATRHWKEELDGAH